MSFSEPKVPTAEELSKLQKSDADWVKQKAKGNQEIADIRAETQASREASNRDWQRKTEALKALQPTGNLEDDARAYFKAIEFDPAQVGAEYNRAFETGNMEDMLRYFEDALAANANQDRSIPAAQECQNTKHEFIAKMLEAYKRKKS